MQWLIYLGISILIIIVFGIIWRNTIQADINHLKQEKDNLVNFNAQISQENELLIKQRENSSLVLNQLQTEIENIKIKNQILQEQREGLVADLDKMRIVIENTISEKKNIANKAFEVYCDSLDLEYQSAERHYDILYLRLQEVYEQQQDQLMTSQQLSKEELNKELQNIQAELNKMRATRLAAIEAQLQEQAIKEQKNFYSLQLDAADKRDVAYLQSIEFNLREARPLRMLIWSTFYRDKLNALAMRVGAVGACGIYKITHTDSGACYIGQARDIKERWSEHCKKALGIDTPTTSKLYAFMREQGLDNFTFEILEKCSVNELNEKEQFYINLYSAAEFGLNSNKGIGK